MSNEKDDPKKSPKSQVDSINKTSDLVLSNVSESVVIDEKEKSVKSNKNLSKNSQNQCLSKKRERNQSKDSELPSNKNLSIYLNGTKNDKGKFLVQFNIYKIFSLLIQKLHI